MGIVTLTAFGVGGATILGGIIGFLFKNTNRKLQAALVSFAAGVMLCAAIVGLILPAMDGTFFQVLLALVGIILGAIVLSFINRLLPELQILVGVDESTEEINKALLLIAAIAIHNFPEGLASGVSFGCDKTADAILIAGGIALQNLPEGMVIIAPMLSAGISPLRTFCFAALTGILEIVGTFVGYAIIHTCGWVLPFALGFAGGTMLYIISEEMIPSTHDSQNDRWATFSLIVGFCIVLISNHFLD